MATTSLPSLFFFYIYGRLEHGGGRLRRHILLLPMLNPAGAQLHPAQTALQVVSED